MLALTNGFHNTKTTVRMVDADLTRLVMAVEFDNDDEARKKLLRRSAKTSFDYEREDDHAAWVASNNVQQAMEEAERRQELADRTHAHQDALALAQFEGEDDYIFRSQENLKAILPRPSSR